MATSTTNIGLTLPVGTENVSRQVINGNMSLIDAAVGALPNGSNLQDEIDANSNRITLLISSKGQANGIASLDGNGKIPSAQVPTLVTAVLISDNKYQIQF